MMNSSGPGSSEFGSAVFFSIVQWLTMCAEDLGGLDWNSGFVICQWCDNILDKILILCISLV